MSTYHQSDPLAGHDTYETVSALSKGSYGSVFLAKDRQTGERYALKFIKRGASSSGADYIRREIVNHMKLRHPHVIALHEVFLTQTHLVLVMEYARCGDLFNHVHRHKGLTEKEAHWFFQQIVLALDYCHRMGVCIRDIKLENTLLDGPDRCAPNQLLVKLCDFGFSKHAELDSAPESLVGTPAYLAPEVISRVGSYMTPSGSGPPENKANTYDGTAADIWSLGVLLYAMVIGTYPFQPLTSTGRHTNQDLNDLYERITKAQFSFPETIRGRPLSPEFCDFVKQMLVKDPENRATLQQLMQHSWFTRGLLDERWAQALQTNDYQVTEELRNPAVSQEMQEEIRLLVEDAQCPHYEVSPSRTNGTGMAEAMHGASDPTNGRRMSDQVDFSTYEEQVDNMVLGGESLGAPSTDLGSAMLEQI